MWDLCFFSVAKFWFKVRGALRHSWFWRNDAVNGKDFHHCRLQNNLFL